MSEEVDKLIEETNLEYMLEFETQIFLDVIHKDGLVVAAKGLNLDLVVLNVLKVYCDPGNLVMVLNATDAEEKYFSDKLQDPNNVHISANCPTNADERKVVYLSGGINFTTTRILVVDLLKNRVPTDKITGFILLRAHQILESCQEAFVLRLYRQNNKTGFIKAFSNSPQSFTMGFGHVERIMRTVFVKELYIWPRFHSVVMQSFKKHEPIVIELHVPITEKMKKMQTCVLELMNLTVKELKRTNKSVELQEITVENCLTKKFHKILQAQLDSIWNRMSEKSKQLVSDLKTLRHLISTMFYSDSITFYSVVSEYRTMEYAKKAAWVLYQPAEMLFSLANSTVLNGEKELNPDFCPKWDVLLELLKEEIPGEIKKSHSKENTVLILCSDKKTCHQLNQLLTNGPHHYLFLLALKNKIPFKSLSKSFQKLPNVETKCKKLEEEEEEEDFQSTYVLTMNESVLGDDEDVNNDACCVFEPFTQLECADLTQICESLTAPKILIQTFKGSENYISLQNTLQAIQPNYVILYHVNITTVREIEMYEAHRRNTTPPLKVYFLIHAETVEEQSYLTTLQREKEAFELLIQTKSTMVVPEDQDGKDDQCLALQRHLHSPLKSTRHGGKEEETARRVVVVDMREFRSELPALVHKRGIEIEPVTIAIGDYILTPEICVERKSLSDLIGSLNSGRLYQQCTQMCRYYARPMLLIEFDQNKAFSWQNSLMVSNDVNSFEIQQKLLLLTMHFPKLRLIWSPNPYASAQLFDELKLGKGEPQAVDAASIGGEQDLDVIEAKYNVNIYDFVQKLPGITSKNIDAFLRRAGNMDRALKMTEDELKEVLGNSSDAKSFYSILHDEQCPDDSKKDNSKWKGKATKSGFRGKFKSK